RRAQLRDPVATAACQVCFIDVCGVQNRLCGQQPEAAQELHRVFTFARLPRPTAAIELRDDALQQHQLDLRFLVTGPRRLARLLEPALDDCEIGERQLTGD